jgi:hypothetical protein
VSRTIPLATILAGLLVASCSSATPSQIATASVPSERSPSPSEPSASNQGGDFIGGVLQAEQTGAASRTWDLQLVEDQSSINGDTIGLVYGSGSGAGLGETVAITIEGDQFTVIADGGVAHFDGGSGEGCTFVPMPNHGSGVAGTFDCKDLSALAGDESVIGPVDFSGTFEADE